MKRLTFALFLVLIAGAGWSLTACQMIPQANVQLREAILVSGRKTQIYWRDTDYFSSPLPSSTAFFPTRWTPDGEYLVWLNPEINYLVIWLSDPCGQTSPVKVFDSRDYPNLRFDFTSFGWLDGDSFLIYAIQKTPGKQVDGIWRFDISSHELNLWIPEEAPEHILSPQVLLIWNQKEGSRLWTPRGVFSAPEDLPIFPWRQMFLSPDGHWLTWRGRTDGGIFIAPFSLSQGIDESRIREVPLHGTVLGWTTEGPKLVVKSGQLLEDDRVRYKFRLVDPHDPENISTTVFESTASFSIPVFMLSPLGDAVGADWTENVEGKWYHYLKLWDIRTGEKLTFYQQEGGSLYIQDWALIDVSQCPHPPAVPTPTP